MSISPTSTHISTMSSRKLSAGKYDPTLQGAPRKLGFYRLLAAPISTITYYYLVGGMAETSEPLLREKCDRCLLRDMETFRSPRNNARISLCLTATTLEYTDSNGSPALLDLADVIGVKVSDVFGDKGPDYDGRGGRIDGARAKDGYSKRDQQHVLGVFAYVPVDMRLGCPVQLCPRQRISSHLRWLASDARVARQWEKAINAILRSPGEVASTVVADSEDIIRSRTSVGPGRRLLVLINPVSGRGSSLSAWSNTVRPMLEQSMADITLIISTRRGEHMDVIRRAGTRGAVSIKGSISPKGESMVEEAHAVDGSKESNGKRAGSKMEIDVGDLDDFDGVITIGGDGTFFEVLQGLYARPDYERQLARLSFGIIPAGSGNGLAKTICEESGEEFGVVGASFLAAKGSTRKMDLLPTEVGDQRYLGFLNVGWGMVSDVDVESEAYRWMGSFRFTFGTIVRVIGLRHYRGRISFVPASSNASGNDTISLGSLPAAPFRMPPLSEPVGDTGGQELNAKQSGVSGDKEAWVTVEGEFILADMAQVKYISHDMPMAPASRLGDGLITLFFVRKGTGRIGITKMFLAMEKGEHMSLDHPCLEWHCVKAFRIEPLTSGGRLTVDGELVDYTPLQQHVWSRATNVMCASLNS